MDHNTREAVVHTGVQYIIRDDKVMRKKKMLLGFYDYTVILTYTGMLSAFAGILFSINSNFKAAIICLMFAGFCDMFDGAVASTKERTKNEKRFGIQIDSMSDIISFGILPAVFIYMYSGKTVFAAIIAAIYARKSSTEVNCLSSIIFSVSTSMIKTLHNDTTRIFLLKSSSLLSCPVERILYQH